MLIAVLGARGNLGRLVVAQALGRGFTVRAISPHMDPAEGDPPPRVIALIGSAGARTAHGERLVDTDYFAETTRHFYRSVEAAWDVYRRRDDLDWVAFVPAARMQHHLPGRGTYRTRTNEQLVTTDDTSRRYFDVGQLSYGDCARAMLDEIGHPGTPRAFVTLGW